MVGKTISHYQILEKLGEGGMGAVYRAFDSQLRRPVALKVLLPEHASDPERRERLLREAHVAVVPGEAFGTDHHIRISYAASMQDLDRGLTRIEQFLARLS